MSRRSIRLGCRFSASANLCGSARPNKRLPIAITGSRPARRCSATSGWTSRLVPANDPFFGRGGKLMAATQKEQELKYELVVPVATAEKPTAVSSCNCHLDHFGHAFGIKTPDGKDRPTAPASASDWNASALALFRKHGFDPDRWPASVKQILEL